jgi:hypothetical protein
LINTRARVNTCRLMSSARDERALDRARRRWLLELPPRRQLGEQQYVWSSHHHRLETGIIRSQREDHHFWRKKQRNALLEALRPLPVDMVRDPLHGRLPLYGLPAFFYKPIVAYSGPEIKLGPGPKCRFCLKLLRSGEWELERCSAHYEADIRDCPATEYSLLRHSIVFGVGA